MTLVEFFPEYMDAHSRYATRALHTLGLVVGWSSFWFAILRREWWAMSLLPISAYGFGFFAHLWVEKNRPASFKHPFLSIACDHVMAALFIPETIMRIL